jgi:hypothetical protein
VLEEEARVEAAHVAVRDGAGVDDALVLHLLAAGGGAGLVDPVGLRECVLASRWGGWKRARKEGGRDEMGRGRKEGQWVEV